MEPVKFWVFSLLIFIRGQFPVFEDLIVAEGKKDAEALAVLLGVWFVEDVRKHVVVLDGERARLEIIVVAHEIGEEDVFND
jgi:hypothetical protein